MKILKFYAEWCSPCKQLTTIIDKFKKEHPEIEIIPVNVDEEEELVIKYSVRNIPVLVKVDEEDNEISRKVGAISYKKLEEFILN